MKPDYSAIIPVYNSSATLEQLTGEIEQVFKGIGKTYEIIFVDDGSSDSSWQVLKGIKQAHDNINIILLEGNHGQNTATLCGIHHSIGKQIITIDDDLQYPSKEILKLIEFYNANNYQIVYGQPARRMHGVAHRIIATLTSLGFDYFILPSHSRVKFYTTFRLMAREQFFNADDTVLTSRHLFYFWEIDAGFMGSLEVEHEARKSKNSTYSISKLLLHYQPQLLYSTKRVMTFLLLLVGIGGISGLVFGTGSTTSIAQSLTLVSVFLLLLLIRYLSVKRLEDLREVQYTIAEKTD